MKASERIREIAERCAKEANIIPKSDTVSAASYLIGALAILAELIEEQGVAQPTKEGK